jgi:predicted transcriptional regulator
MLLIDDAKRGLADIAAGRTFEADGAIAQLQQRRVSTANALTSSTTKKKRG